MPAEIRDLINIHLQLCVDIAEIDLELTRLKYGRSY